MESRPGATMRASGVARRRKLRERRRSLRAYLVEPPLVALLALLGCSPPRRRHRPESTTRARVDRGLRRAQRCPARVLGGHERRAGRRPGKARQALLTITGREQPPFRFIAGGDALAQTEEKLAERQQQIDAFRELSSSLALDEVAG